MNLRVVPDQPSQPDQPGLRRPTARRSGDNDALVALINRSSRGDETAFAELYDRTATSVYGMVRKVVRDPSQTDEVTQEVYVEVWRLSAQYDPSRASVLGWISMLAHRRAVDRVRGCEADRQRVQRVARPDPAESNDQVWDSVEERLDARRVRDGLASLTPLQRESLELAYFGGYTQTQVAALLKIPLGTVKTRIRDGIIGLRDALRIEPDTHRGTS